MLFPSSEKYLKSNGSLNWSCLPSFSYSISFIPLNLCSFSTKLFHLALFTKNVIIFSLSLTEIGPYKNLHILTTFASQNLKSPNRVWVFDEGFQKWPQVTPKGLPTKRSTTDLPQQTYGIEVMHYVYQLLQLALHHVHVYKCWKMFWNLYLEKKPGHPSLDSLQTLHLFGADYNLLLKWHLPLGFTPKSEKNHHILDSQGGGRAGQNAIDLACKKVVIYDYFSITSSEAREM